MSAHEFEHNAAMEADNAETKAAAQSRPAASVQVMVCLEKGGELVVVSRWRVSAMSGVGACHGDAVGGLAHLSRVVKMERERRGL